MPPAWRDVWICRHHNGHLQAVGLDAAGRRQYLYHPLWRERRDAAKFDHMLDFARRLPDLRAACVAALEGRDGLEFDYPAKGGKRRVQHVADPAVVEVVGRLRRRRTGGPELLACREGGDWVDVTADDVNRLVKRHCGEDSSAKDFRTWNATVLDLLSDRTAAEGVVEHDRVVDDLRGVA